MPIAICRACKSYAGKAIAYITNEKKAERVYIYGLDESRSLAQQFIDTAKLFGKGEKFDERKYYHFKFSFEPKDRIENGGKLNAELAEKIANEYLQKHYSGNEYVLAIHTDTEHIHAHAIINAVSFEDGKKIQHSNRYLAKMKDEINDIAEKYEISRFDWKKSVKEKRQRLKQEQKKLQQTEKYVKEDWKEGLKAKIDEAKGICANRSEFQEYLKKSYGIEMPRNTKETVSFKYPSNNIVIRGTKLGVEYTAKRIDEKLKLNLEKGISYSNIRHTGEISRVNSEEIIAKTEQTESNRDEERSAKNEYGILLKKEIGEMSRKFLDFTKETRSSGYNEIDSMRKKKAKKKKHNFEIGI